MKYAENSLDEAMGFKQTWADVVSRGYCEEYDLKTQYRKALERVASWYGGKVRKCPNRNAFMITFTFYDGFGYQSGPRCKLRVRGDK